MKLWWAKRKDRIEEPIPQKVYIKLDENNEFYCHGRSEVSLRDDLRVFQCDNKTEVYAEYELKSFKKVSWNEKIKDVDLTNA